jgi:hypothetical protein
MLRRDISNQLSLLTVADFESLIDPPQSPFWAKLMEKTWRWPFAHACAFLLFLYFCRPSLEAEKSGYWILDHGVRLAVIVRVPMYFWPLAKRCESLLKEYPNERFHYLPYGKNHHLRDLGRSIAQMCNNLNAVRFYTTDADLARYIPVALVKHVKDWLSEPLFE